jgi:hypothetical protein
MKFKAKKHDIGETRICTAFLFLPKGLLNDEGLHEIRWLERAFWSEEFLGYIKNDMRTKEIWIPQRWED